MASKSGKIDVKKSGNEDPERKTPPPAMAAGYHPLQNLREEIDHLFDRFFHGGVAHQGFWNDLRRLDPFRDMTTLHRFAQSAPRADMAETNKTYQITAELPGIDQKDVELTVSDSMLTLSGEKKSEREEKDEHYHLTERSFGSFKRVFPLPDEVDAGKISAEFDKGVLTVTLPKAPSKTKQRKIGIKAK